MPRAADARHSGWQGRLDDQPDIYLLLPDCEDMGIKWREGLLQIKGRVERVEDALFGGHAGVIERWIKWSYADLPAPCRAIFEASGASTGRRTVAVHKQRLLRLVQVDDDAGLLEVAPGRFIERGVAVELTDLDIDGAAFTTVGFEGFPDDAVVERSFAAVVEAFLADWPGDPLTLARSLSYPAWLGRPDSLR